MINSAILDEFGPNVVHTADQSDQRFSSIVVGILASSPPGFAPLLEVAHLRLVEPKIPSRPVLFAFLAPSRPVLFADFRTERIAE